MTVDSKNSLFSASLLFRSLRDGKFLESNLWEESIVLIEALSDEEALEIATALGKQRGLSYRSVDQVEVTWEFFAVERVFTLDTSSISSGSELFSRHLRSSEVQSLLQPFEE